jgi:hypothetical protein
MLLLAAYFVTGLLGTDRAERRTAFVLVALSSGLATTLLVLRLVTGLEIPVVAVEREHPEFNTFLVLFTAPHIIIGLALLLVAGRVYGACWVHPVGWRHALLPALVLALGVINPFGVAALVPVVVAHGVAMAVRTRSLSRPGHGAAVVVLAAAAPTILVNLLTFNLDPFWGATYGGQNSLPSPPLEEIASALGLLAPAALVGLPRLLRSPSPERLLVPVWIAAMLLAMHLPIMTQRRLALGLHPLVAMTAAYGVLEIVRVLRERRSRCWRVARLPILSAFGLVAFGTSAMTYLIALAVAIGPVIGYGPLELATADRSPYQPQSVKAAADWLAEHETADDLVLSATVTANYLAGRAPGRVYVGHQVATLAYFDKVERMGWFFAGPLDEERLAFLRANGVRYVVYGPYERHLNPALRPPPDAQFVFSAPDIDVIDVRALATAGEGERTVPDSASVERGSPSPARAASR